MVAECFKLVIEYITMTAEKYFYQCQNDIQAKDDQEEREYIHHAIKIAGTLPY